MTDALAQEVHGSVIVGGDGLPNVSITTDGACLKATLENLRNGVGARPMDAATLESARQQSLRFLEEIVKHYEAGVARGEVGASGAGTASLDAPIDGVCPTGLLYGRVQSGKTLAMITLSAAAFDNGFKLVIVFTSNYLELVKQTRKRFQAIDGRKIFDSTRPEDWEPESDHIARQLARSGVVIVCAKDSTHTRALVSLIERTQAANYPALIFDDEADQATPDTTTAARARGGENAPIRGSSIFRRIVLNDDQNEVGHSVCEKLKHNVFVQVTATPYALLLQRVEHPLRPRFTLLVEPGRGYTGGESFFATRHVTDERGAPPLVLVPSTEETELSSSTLETPPTGLSQAICFFLLSSAAQALAEPSMAADGQNFLCHTSMKKGEHERLCNLIRRYVDGLENALIQGLPNGDPSDSLRAVDAELRRTVPDAPPFEQLTNWLRQRIHLRTFYVVNSDRSDASFSNGINFIVGGNILGRGLTIDNLLVTYYLRSSKVTQMDTMLQHARMFGYRARLMPYTRVFLPSTLALRFHHIHESEQHLRDQFRDATNPEFPTIQRVTHLRPTRINVLDGTSIATFEPGQHLYPYAPVFRRDAVGQSERKVRQLIRRLMGRDGLDFRYADVTIEEIKALMKAVPVSEADADRWDPRAIASVLDSIAEQTDDRGYLYVRSLYRSKTTLMTGAVSDTELMEAKEKPRPVLFLFHEIGQAAHWEGVPFFYPSLVLPNSMKARVFNISG